MRNNRRNEDVCSEFWSAIFGAFTVLEHFDGGIYTGLAYTHDTLMIIGRYLFGAIVALTSLYLGGTFWARVRCFFDS
jgi:small basic protein